MGADTRDGVTAALKRMRATPGLNRLATTPLRALTRLTGSQSELLVKHLPRSGRVRCRLPDGKVLTMITRGDDWIPNQLFWRGFQGYEPEAAGPFYNLAARARVTIDVGAYVGYYALLAAVANPSGRVFAFEPLPALRGRLQTNCHANGATNVVCVGSAVADRDGEAKLFVMAGAETPSSSSLSYDFMRPLEKNGHLGSVKVPVETIDGFCDRSGIQAVDLVKIDTESTEADVVRGMRSVVARDRPHIVCEVLPGGARGPEMQEFLEPLGYRYYALEEHGAVEQPVIAPHPSAMNQLFTVLDRSQLAEFAQWPVS